jgi:Cu(I)/Ag(I) efflux system membrane fusion protein
VPAGAVLDTGGRQTVFVDRGEGYLEPRAVTTGARTGDRIAILSGLTAGERVVASGTFLVDSESQLRSALAGMGAGHATHGAPATGSAPAATPPAPPARDPAAHRPASEEPHHD